ncbi:hypothetical protein BN1002_00831 [Bacillus sp. B-jedd]|nr:hypothetical protein BN1002_00831 [Bacillus sp. B-jedd]
MIVRKIWKSKKMTGNIFTMHPLLQKEQRKSLVWIPTYSKNYMEKSWKRRRAQFC